MAPDATAGRLVVLAVTSVLAPIVLAVQYARGGELRVPEIVASCIVMFLLVLARMAGLVRTQRMMAVTDGLTGLRTRRYLEAALRGEADRVRRGGGSSGFLLIDVDHFKTVNDSYGHQAGDRVVTAGPGAPTPAKDVAGPSGEARPAPCCEPYAAVRAGSGPQASLG